MSDIGNCIINTTPHDIVVYRADSHGTHVELVRYPSCREAQLRMEQAPQAELSPCGAVPVVAAPTFTHILGPVDALANSTVLVSMPVGEFIRRHHDAAEFEEMRVYGPDTSPEQAVRDDQGRIIGTRRLIMYKP